METTQQTRSSFRADAYLARLMGELDRAEISKRLSQSREVAGLTQAEMADTLGVHERSVQDYESPKKPTVPFDRLDEWAAVTGVTKGWLLQGDELVTPGERLDQLEAQMARAIELLEEILGAAHGGSAAESA